LGIDLCFELPALLLQFKQLGQFCVFRPWHFARLGEHSMDPPHTPITDVRNALGKLYIVFFNEHAHWMSCQ